MTYPTSQGFENVDIIDHEAVQVSEAGNLRTQARSLNAQRWELKLSHPLMTRANAAPLMAYLKSVRGPSSSFQIILPSYFDALGDVAGVMRANGIHSAGDNTIAVDGISGTISAGSFVKFNDHGKVYMVTEDLTGPGTLTIYPSLRESVANNEVVTYDSVPFTVRLDDNKQTYSASTGNNIRVAFTVIEAF